jgi:hypothetical protein
MSTAPATETKQATSSTTDRASRPAPRLTAGYGDGLGERVLMFDEAAATSLELLRFKRELSDSPAFETALHSRIAALASVRHPALGVVQMAERRGGTNDLTLVSQHTPGRRLSEILQAARGAAFALDFLSQIGPAVVVLQQQGQDVAHGALTVDRVIVGREGRLVLVEHVLGSALSALKLPAARMRSELGIAVPAKSEAPAIDQRLDVIQLGFIALTLLLGRRVDPADYPAKVSEHLDRFTKEDAEAAAKLRPWLERALQIGDRPFRNAKAALDVFYEMTGAPARGADGETSAAAPSAKTIHVTSPASSSEIFPSETGKKESRARKSGPSRTLTVVFGVVATLEAVVIAGLLYTRPASGAVPSVDPPAAPPVEMAAAPVATGVAGTLDGPTVQDSAAPEPTPLAPAAAAVPQTAVPQAAGPKAEAEPAPPPGARFGGIRIASPIDLQVLEGGRLVGSTAGPIATNDGAHTLELVNESLGFRFRQTVQVRPGQMTTVNIAVPNGRVSINAAPWAEVWIDGTAAGQTPLANLSLPIGQHEIVFRHPQLGEQKQTVTVKAEGLTRVSAVLQK